MTGLLASVNRRRKYLSYYCRYVKCTKYADRFGKFFQLIDGELMGKTASQIYFFQ
jgi:hypothetical protein